MNKYNGGMEMKKINVYQICECDAVAAESLNEAYEWYAKLTGFQPEDLYELDEIGILEDNYMVRDSEESENEYISVKEIVEKYWDGKPFIAVSKGGC